MDHLCAAFFLDVPEDFMEGTEFYKKNGEANMKEKKAADNKLSPTSKKSYYDHIYPFHRINPAKGFFV